MTGAEGKLVLVVDDDDSLRTALLRLLKAAGLGARGYASADEFLAEPPPEHAGCMLLDLKMPGTSGLELQEQLQRRGVDLPIIFLSGHGDEDAIARALKAGAIDFLHKPVDHGTLLDAVQRALAAGATASARPR